MNKNAILEKAINIAKSLPKQKYKLVATITDKKGRILSWGYNSYSKTSPTQAYYAEKTGYNLRIYLHSEIDAILKLKYTDKPYAIFIVRINHNGEPVFAKPCEICQKAIQDIGIKKIYYTENK
jgi:deoxycytidylate deaminase